MQSNLWGGFGWGAIFEIALKTPRFHGDKEQSDKVRWRHTDGISSPAEFHILNSLEFIKAELTVAVCWSLNIESD